MRAVDSCARPVLNGPSCSNIAPTRTAAMPAEMSTPAARRQATYHCTGSLANPTTRCQAAATLRCNGGRSVGRGCQRQKLVRVCAVRASSIVGACVCVLVVRVCVRGVQQGGASLPTCRACPSSIRHPRGLADGRFDDALFCNWLAHPRTPCHASPSSRRGILSSCLPLAAPHGVLPRGGNWGSEERHERVGRCWGVWNGGTFARGEQGLE